MRSKTRRPRKSSGGSGTRRLTPTPLPPGASQEEDAQFDELRHPWSGTLRDFLAAIEERYGWRLAVVEFMTTDLQKRGVVNRYLQSPDKEVNIHLPGDLGLDDQLDEFSTGSLCRRLGVPPEDFGLPQEEPYDELDPEDD